MLKATYFHSHNKYEIQFRGMFSHRNIPLNMKNLNPPIDIWCSKRISMKTFSFGKNDIFIIAGLKFDKIKFLFYVKRRLIELFKTSESPLPKYITVSTNLLFVIYSVSEKASQVGCQISRAKLKKEEFSKPRGLYLHFYWCRSWDENVVNREYAQESVPFVVFTIFNFPLFLSHTIIKYVKLKT